MAAVSYPGHLTGAGTGTGTQDLLLQDAGAVGEPGMPKEQCQNAQAPHSITLPKNSLGETG